MADTTFQIKDIKIGTGKEVINGDYVTIHYAGTLENGQKFDSSYDRGEPFKTRIGVGEVIEGWDMGVVGMKVGGKRKLVIPPQLAYGDREIGIIPANSTLIFEVELLDVE
jgi:peptidylprolyl isomerase